MLFFEKFLNAYKNNIGVITADTFGTIKDVNPYLLTMTDYTKKELIDKNLTVLVPAIAEYFDKQQIDSSFKNFHTKLQKPDLSHIPVEIVFCALGDSNNLVKLFIKDISFIEDTKSKITFLTQLFNTAKEAIMVTDVNGHILCINKRFSEITGFSDIDVLGKTPSVLSSGKQDAEFYKNFWNELLSQGAWEGEIWNKRKNGEIYPEWLRVTSARNQYGKITNFIALFSDLTKQKQSKEEKHFLKFYDGLTGLPNRNFLLDKITSLQKSENRKFAILLCDLDRFAVINDSQGFRAGDELLKCVSSRLQASLRKGDFIARSGDDEFVVIVEGEKNVSKTDEICSQLLSIFSDPFNTKKGTFKLTISIGVSIFPHDSKNVRELLSFADSSMQKVKSSGGNHFSKFKKSTKSIILQQLTLEKDLPLAISKQQLEVWYQPQIDAETNTVTGVECLLRWHHPDLGLIPPCLFIPIAESSDVINEIGLFVLETACQQLSLWNKTGAMIDTVAVNISIRQFQSYSFLTSINNILSKTGVLAKSVEFEVTETLLSNSDYYLIPTLTMLRDLGIKISIDDFGTGYSSLQRLKNLPIDNVKIDKCFIDDISTSEKDASIVRALQVIAKTFGFNLIAEGVETEAQAEKLKTFACNHHQGYLYSRPLPAEKFIEWLTKFNAKN